MLYDYTEEESAKLQAFEDEQSARPSKLQEELSKLDRGAPEYNSKLEEFTASMDDYIQGYNSLKAEFEKAHFDALGGDPETILQNGIDQAPKILEFYYLENCEFDAKHPETPNNAKLEIGAATEIINRELHLHFDALSKDPGRLKTLKDSIYKCISASPYVYTNIQNNISSTNITNLIERATKPPKLKKYGIEKDKVNKIPLLVEPTVKNIDGQLYMAWAVNQANKEKAPVPIIFGLSSLETENAKTSRRIEIQDDALLTTVSNLTYILKEAKYDGPIEFTPQEIWRQNNGITDGITSPSDKQLFTTENSLDKMQSTLLYMDIRNEINAHFTIPNDDRIKEGIVKDYYLPSRATKVRTEKGRIEDGYRIYDIPFLYVYNLSKGHLVLVDQSLLNTTDTIANLEFVPVFRYYLLREIAEMYSGDRDSNIILYNSLYSGIGIDPPETRYNRSYYASENAYKTTIRRKKDNEREKIKRILDSWKNKNWILDYKPIKSGRTERGLEIILNPINFNTTKAK